MAKDFEIAAPGRFDKLFDDAKKEIFRLETYPEYRVGAENGELKYFLKHSRMGPESKDSGDWYAKMARARDRGVNYWRVRRLSVPRTPYERYELAAYKRQIPHGLKVWAFNRHQMPHATKELDEVPYAMDYWMFDGKKIIFIQYDLLGKYMQTLEYTGDPTPYIKLRDRLKKISKRII